MIPARGRWESTSAEARSTQGGKHAHTRREPFRPRGFSINPHRNSCPQAFAHANHSSRMTSLFVTRSRQFSTPGSTWIVPLKWDKPFRKSMLVLVAESAASLQPRFCRKLARQLTNPGTETASTGKCIACSKFCSPL